MHRAGTGRVAYPTSPSQSSFAVGGEQVASDSEPRRPIMGKISDMWSKVTGEVGARRWPGVAIDDLLVGRVRARRERRPASAAGELRHLARRQGARGERGSFRNRLAAALT